MSGLSIILISILTYLFMTRIGEALIKSQAEWINQKFFTEGIYKHKRNGKLYKIVSWGAFKKEYPEQKGIWSPTSDVFYKDVYSGKQLYQRHIDDFNEKFEKVK